MARTLEDYLTLPYTIVLRRDVKDEIVVARVEELPGCSAHGITEMEALSNLRDNVETWIEDCLESGDPVPEPMLEIELPSGKWLQRVPRSLHLKLIRLAKEEGVSLNQFVTAVLAESAGEKAAQSNKASAVSLVAFAEADPWSVVSRIGEGEWVTRSHPALDQRKLNHSLRSLLRRTPATEANSITRGLKRGDAETHENWNTEHVEVAGR